MRVLQIVPNVFKESSGPSYSTSCLAKALKYSGVDVLLYALGHYKESDFSYTVRGFPTDFLCGGLAHSTKMYLAIRSFANDADVFHVNSLWLPPNIYPGIVVSKLKRTRALHIPKLVTSPRGTFAKWALQQSQWKKKAIGLLGQYKALDATDMFHATSEKEYEEIRALGYRQPVAIVPIGMDIPCGSEVKVRGGESERGVKGESGEKVRGGEGEKGELHRIAFFGRLHKVKAVDRLIQAWEILNGEDGERVRVGEWELVIAGPDNGIRGELEAYIAEHKIPRVKFVGEINGPAKYEFLSAADIYVLPSHTENFGVTVAEALACKTPVVVSKGTPWSGVVENGCGRWVDNSPAALADALAELMALPEEKRREMGENGREWIRRDFSWEGVGAKMKAAYEWLLDPDGVERPEWVRID